jgi:hypothetical protein
LPSLVFAIISICYHYYLLSLLFAIISICYPSRAHTYHHPLFQSRKRFCICFSCYLAICLILVRIIFFNIAIQHCPLPIYTTTYFPVSNEDTPIFSPRGFFSLVSTSLTLPYLSRQTAQHFLQFYAPSCPLRKCLNVSFPTQGVPQVVL